MTVAFMSRVSHPLHRGCGLKLKLETRIMRVRTGHPLHRGCGLKSLDSAKLVNVTTSPPSQGVWIEIPILYVYTRSYSRHPLHRGCGLK